MEQMILKKPLLDDLKEIKEALVGQGDPILAFVLNRAIACVEKQPEAKAVRGLWLPTSYMIPTVRCSICSQCVAQEFKHKYNYCPNCGAMMDGGKDNGV